jgi:pimeloyl-ACP methyl ester carboxylesterase
LLIAISLGAMVGLSWWLRWPSELRGLVGINTSAGRVCPPWWRLQPAAALATFAAMRERDAIARELHVLALTSRVRAGDRELAREHAGLHAREPIAAANVVRQMIAAARFRVPRSLRSHARPPLLLLAARGDRMVDPRCTPALARSLGAAHFLHGDAGHDLTLDDPAWCTARIAEWVAAQS